MLFYSLDDKIQQKVAGKNKKYVKSNKKKHKKQKKLHSHIKLRMELFAEN